MNFPREVEHPKIMPGPQVFDFLRAEDEPWLAECFVPPPEFNRMRGENSVIVFGGLGTGKTTIYKLLRAQCVADGEPTHLLVDWRPIPRPPDIAISVSGVKRQTDHLVDACAMALAAYLAQRPNRFASLPEWAKTQMIWFIRKAIQGNLTARLGPLLDESPDSGATLLAHIQDAQVEDVIYHPSSEQLVVEWLPALRKLGLSGVWVMMDGLEGWAERDPDGLARQLRALFSVLGLFEQGLVFKVLLPAYLEPMVIRAGGVARRRIGGVRLQWDVPRLRQLVEKRLALALGIETFSLEQLCSAPVGVWLERAGGGSPREWLDQIKPLVRHYLIHQLSSPVDQKTWLELCRQHPPRFWMDETALLVRVGGRDIPLDDLPATAYAMLRYLYQNSGSLVSKAELYFLVYRGLDKVPHSYADEHYESPKEYIGVIDTSIYRIRQAIEPNPSEPVLLQTVRGHGVTLVSRW
ncbi:MAG: winged helix-turn-helix domain-containing protein [Chloroflexota bacterium]